MPLLTNNRTSCFSGCSTYVACKTDVPFRNGVSVKIQILFSPLHGASGGDASTRRQRDGPVAPLACLARQPEKGLAASPRRPPSYTLAARTV